MSPLRVALLGNIKDLGAALIRNKGGIRIQRVDSPIPSYEKFMLGWHCWRPSYCRSFHTPWNDAKSWDFSNAGVIIVVTVSEIKVRLIARRGELLNL